MPVWSDVPFPATVDEALRQADRQPSRVPGAHGMIEGFVWRRTDASGDGTSFKVISNAYALTYDA